MKWTVLYLQAGPDNLVVIIFKLANKSEEEFTGKGIIKFEAEAKVEFFENQTKTFFIVIKRILRYAFYCRILSYSFRSGER